MVVVVTIAAIIYVLPKYESQWPRKKMILDWIVQGQCTLSWKFEQAEKAVENTLERMVKSWRTENAQTTDTPHRSGKSGIKTRSLFKSRANPKSKNLIN